MVSYPAMRLTECAAFVPIAVERDAEFGTLGFLIDPQPGMLVFLENARFLPLLARGREAVSCVLTVPDLASRVRDVAGLAVCAEPRRAFFDLHNHLARHTSFYGASEPTVVDPSATVHPLAFVAPTDVTIGPQTDVQPHAAILEGSTVGARVLIQPGVVLGGAGLQVSRFPDGVVDLQHAGRVVVEDDVHLLAHAVVARAVFRQATTVGAGCRVGNHAFVSHNAQIGPRSFVGHGAVVNGNVVTGRDCWIGPGAVISHGVRVGDGARISLGATVVQDVEPGQQVSGNFAMEHRQFLRRLARREQQGRRSGG
jgi:UDP-3-O-[3-hydroxymyristoyl] glucosamine N-acyltransferase